MIMIKNNLKHAFVGFLLKLAALKFLKYLEDVFSLHAAHIQVGHIWYAPAIPTILPCRRNLWIFEYPTLGPLWISWTAVWYRRMEQNTNGLWSQLPQAAKNISSLRRRCKKGTFHSPTLLFQVHGILVDTHIHSQCITWTGKVRDVCGYQNGLIFGNIQNSLWPSPHPTHGWLGNIPSSLIVMK